MVTVESGQEWLRYRFHAPTDTDGLTKTISWKGKVNILTNKLIPMAPRDRGWFKTLEFVSLDKLKA